MSGNPRDRKLIDTLETLESQAFEGHVWRVTRDGGDPTLFFGGGNRWDDGTFEVLYTSLSRDGALTEMKFHLGKGQPVIPSKIRYRLHELHVRVNGVLDLTSPDVLSSVGIDLKNFGRLPYLDRRGEYEACQQVAETAHFLGSDDSSDPSGILVPNARHESQNLVLFADYVKPDEITHLKDHGLIDWDQL